MSQYNKRIQQERKQRERENRQYRKNQSSREKPSLRQILGNPVVAVGLVVLACVIFVLCKRNIGTGGSYYCNGIYINNVDMSVYKRDEGEQALTQWAQSLLDTSYTLSYEGRTWTFSPRSVDAKINTEEILRKAWNLGHTGTAKEQSNVMMSLRQAPQYFVTEQTYSEEKLDDFIDSVARELYIAPVDADILVTDTKPVVLSQSRNGRKLDTDGLKATLISRILAGGDTNIALNVEEALPAVSSDDAENSLELIVEYYTSLTTSSTKRCSNVKRALDNFNGFTVSPGETVSFNEVVGERSILRGYVEAPVYYGTSVTTGVGGGVCQASSTLYGAVLKAGMTALERHNHTMVVNYCQASMDAAVSEDASQDFVFTNNTDYTIYIYTEVINKEKAIVRVYGRHPQYRIELIPTIVQNNIKNTSITKVKDETGKIAWYTDELVLKEEGKLGRKSKLERVYFDWYTDAEVKRELISDDYYQGERDTYWVGVHEVAR